MQSLAVKYRPTTFKDVVEQDEIKTILSNQIINKDIRNAYLFVGSAGTGKTTCARIFANEINENKGNPIEIDGASNNGVDNVREIIEQAQAKSLDSEYKIFIIDECQMLTIQAWNAMLKLIEEPPLKTIFIFCTTNPEKIPKTILSRVQRFDFKRISQEGIVVRLKEILYDEGYKYVSDELIEYIANLANGGMRDAITLLDKCLSMGELTVDNVMKTLGLAYYNELQDIIEGLVSFNDNLIISTIEKIYTNGVDLKQFIEQLIEYILNYSKWKITGSLQYCNVPNYVVEMFNEINITSDVTNHILRSVIEIYNTIKYNNNSKVIIESMLLLESDTLHRLITGE